MKHLAADIGPEFLQFVVHTVIQDKESKGGGVSKGCAYLPNMVHIENCCRRGIADRFRKIEALVTGIRPHDKETVHGVVRPVSKAPFSQLVVAWIFVQ